MRRRRETSPDPESGQALLEFALVLPLLVMLLFGIVDMSKAYNYWNDHNQLANIAARQAAVGRNPGPVSTYPTLADWVRAQAETDELKTGSSGRGVQTGGVKICITADDGTQVGKPVSVEVQSRYRFLSLPVVGELVQTTMRGRATMRLEATPPAGILTAPCPP